MTTTFEAAVTIVEQLSPAEQARLVVLLTERLQQAVQTASVPDTGDEPAFWAVPVDDVSEVAPEVAHLAVPKSAALAQAETQAMLIGWFGAPLREDDALELAMSESLGEWNLDE
ncbi:MAG: hypothetical protein HGA65_04050 [Oscillochloris sp.]|nr:hypothetical protein [Oscillochloris sp.]